MVGRGDALVSPHLVADLSLRSTAAIIALSARLTRIAR